MQRPADSERGSDQASCSVPCRVSSLLCCHATSAPQGRFRRTLTVSGVAPCPLSWTAPPTPAPPPLPMLLLPRL
eukprot:3336239-Rhodomonas_salina.2